MGNSKSKEVLSRLKERFELTEKNFNIATDGRRKNSTLINANDVLFFNYLEEIYEEFRILLKEKMSSEDFEEIDNCMSKIFSFDVSDEEVEILYDRIDELLAKYNL